MDETTEKEFVENYPEAEFIENRESGNIKSFISARFVDKKVLEEEINKRIIRAFDVGRTSKGKQECVGCGRNWDDCQCEGNNKALQDLKERLLTNKEV